MALNRLQFWIAWAVCMGLFAAGAGGASAQRRGTHFSLELHAGAFALGEVGPGGSAIFGAGGKLPGGPLRMYFLMEGGAVYTAQGDAYRQTLRHAYGQLGVRFLLPVAGPLRLFADALGGFGETRAELDRAWGAVLIEEQVSPQATLAAGFQWRLLYSLSLGMRGQVQLLDDPLDGVRSRLGLDPSGVIWGLTGGITWHF